MESKFQNGVWSLSFINKYNYDKILVLFKLKAFTDSKLIVVQNMKFVFHGAENIVRKGIFSFFPQ